MRSSWRTAHRCVYGVPSWPLADTIADAHTDSEQTECIDTRGCGHAQDGVKGSMVVRSQVASLQNHTSRSSASTAGLLACSNKRIELRDPVTYASTS